MNDARGTTRKTAFARFIHAETTGGAVLLACTLVALLWANSPWGDSYHRLWQMTLTVGLDRWALSKPLLVWINDALMALFFFVVGLEIKREVVVGELSTLRKAMLPIAAAVGGMVFPVLVYLAIAAGAGAWRGWAIPMATDIAFSLGVLALLGSRVPLSLKVFLAALAIVDDIGSVVVIAVFYTETVSVMSLFLAAFVFVLMIAANVLGVRKPLLFFLLGTALWLALLKSGLHPTVAGVLGALTIPVRTLVDAQQFVDGSCAALDHFQRVGRVGEGILTNVQQRAALVEIENLNARAQSPLHRLENALHPWVSCVVMPLFALANAGIVFHADFTTSLSDRLSLGIAFGLVVGKFLGVLGASWITVRLGVTSLPAGVSWRHIAGVSALAGVGFTMSLFIAGLAFGATEELIGSAKVGILAGSTVAAVVGWAVLYSAKRPAS